MVNPIWIAPDMRDHSSGHEFEQGLISEFESHFGVEPLVYYGTVDGLYGLILETPDKGGE